MCSVSYLNLLSSQSQADCELYRKFFGSSQVADLEHVDNYCDSLFMFFSENVANCNYHDLDVKFKIVVNEHLFLVYVNIRSLQKNYESLFETLNSLRLKPDIICISEARIINSNLINIDMPG